MEHQANEEDDEEVVGVPEHLKVGPPYDLHGWGDDEDEGQGDSHARQTSDCGEHHNSRVLFTGREIMFLVVCKLLNVSSIVVLTQVCHNFFCLCNPKKIYVD